MKRVLILIALMFGCLMMFTSAVCTRHVQDTSVVQLVQPNNTLLQITAPIVGTVDNTYQAINLAVCLKPNLPYRFAGNRYTLKKQYTGHDFTYKEVLTDFSTQSRLLCSNQINTRRQVMYNKLE